jgi:hypothetical protein
MDSSSGSRELQSIFRCHEAGGPAALLEDNQLLGYFDNVACLIIPLVESWLYGNPKRQRYQKVQLLVETPAG